MKRKTTTRLALVPQQSARVAGAARVKRYRIARVAAMPPEPRLRTAGVSA